MGVKKDLLKILLAVGVVFVMWALFFNPEDETTVPPVNEVLNEPAIRNRSDNASNLPNSYDELAKYNQIEQQKLLRQKQEEENQKKSGSSEEFANPPILPSTTPNYPDSNEYSPPTPVVYQGGTQPNPGGYYPSEYVNITPIEQTSESAAPKKVPISFGFSKTDAVLTTGNNQSNSEESKKETINPSASSQPGSQNKIGYVNYTKIEPHSLQQGTIIPATLISGLDSSVPGQIIAQTRENVYDSITGNYLLIPQGAKLIGTAASSEVKTGQERIGVNWQRLIFPNGYSVDLGQMPGADISGYTGLKDKVSNHEGKILGATFMTSILSAAAQIASGNTTTSTDQSPGQLAVSGAASSLMNAGSKLLEKNINIAPTIKIRPGTIFNVMVNQDIVLRPYGR